MSAAVLFFPFELLLLPVVSVAVPVVGQGLRVPVYYYTLRYFFHLFLLQRNDCPVTCYINFPNKIVGCALGFLSTTSPFENQGGLGGCRFRWPQLRPL